MKTIPKSIGVLFFLIVAQAAYPALSQERIFQVQLAMDLPQELNLHRSPSCKVEFQEEWNIDPANSSILKTVKSFELPCDDGSSSATLPDGTTRLKNLSFEFSFLDLPEEMAKEIQKAIIGLVNKRYPFPDYYDPQDQLLSIYFHEDWSIESGHKTFTKKVRGLTPIIWQRRQTADGEPLPDPDTGYPVFYKLELERIDLRQP